MNQTTQNIAQLSMPGCRDRQRRLRDAMQQVGVKAAWIRDRCHVHYLTGYWCRQAFAPMVWIGLDEPTLLVAPFEPEHPIAADRVLVYPSNHAATIADHQAPLAAELLFKSVDHPDEVGIDDTLTARVSEGCLIDLTDVLLTMRRHKDEDEVNMLRAGINASQAAYAMLTQTLRPGEDEMQLWAMMHATVAESVGQMLGEFGNDFQIGAMGSDPRRRPCQAGEIAIYDLTVTVRGYASDMCRSFVVGGEPSQRQTAAHARIMTVLDHVEQTARAGTSCRELHRWAIQQLDGFEGMTFDHHLGHGVGMTNHETPRLNEHWDDVLEVGDVIAVEPGLYHPDLREGMRIEQLYRVGEGGLERLTDFSTSLTM